MASNTASLEDRFDVLKEIGDGSFGTVVLARVRSQGAHIARKNSIVAIKTMKKTFESFQPCLELREIIFLRTLPNHPHLVPALDIFLDPYTKKLHVVMENMDGNLYQLMKARDHKLMDASSVKSVLFQILCGLEHIHQNGFFHRDIKPENILVSTTSSPDAVSSFRRYSTLATPPATPTPLYTVKIADFGLARETHSKSPYTTYVSTRWYRAPEVLLRAGEYSAPVDIWAIGAMAVEVATLKPLFPGGNEVDQVWRVCEVMGSPGNWYSKAGEKVGGGEWKDGIRLANKLGFQFPRMPPHSIESLLPAPRWPQSLSRFVTWCLMWDPKHRPTAAQALKHEFFADAVDPLRPKSSASRLMTGKTQKDEPPRLTSSKSSWFRKSLIMRESSTPQSITSKAPSHSAAPSIASTIGKPKPQHQQQDKRATWANGVSTAAPIMLLPSIRPVSPLSNTVHAQAEPADAPEAVRRPNAEETAAKKIGRQLSIASSGHYIDLHRKQAEQALTSGVRSPPSHRESFFSHLRKRARRFSGRHQTPISPADEDEVNVGCAPWSNRSSMVLDQHIEEPAAEDEKSNRMSGIDVISPRSGGFKHFNPIATMSKKALPLVPSKSQEPLSPISPVLPPGPVSSRTRRAVQLSSHPVKKQYDTPDEEDELLSEMLAATQSASKQLNSQPEPHRSSYHQYQTMPNLRQSISTNTIMHNNPYPTPSPSAGNRHSQIGTFFFDKDEEENVAPMKNVPDMTRRKPVHDPSTVSKWPTPPYEENEWAAAAAASIYAAGAAAYR